MTASDDRPLPAHIRRALDAIADGPGRKATTAHPACVCGDPSGEVSPYYADANGDPVPLRHGPDDCPQHRPETA